MLLQRGHTAMLHNLTIGHLPNLALAFTGQLQDPGQCYHRHHAIPHAQSTSVFPQVRAADIMAIRL